MYRLMALFSIASIILLTSCNPNGENNFGAQQAELDDPTNPFVDTGEALPIGDNLDEEIPPSEPDAEREETTIKLVKAGEKYNGKNYKGKGGGKKSDPYSFVEQVYADAGIDVSVEQAIANSASHNRFDEKKKIQPGDLLVFDLDGNGDPDHAAIKMGNGDFLHVNPNANVKVELTNLSQGNYMNTLLYGIRLY